MSALRIGLTGSAAAALIAVGILAVAATASPGGILAADPSQSPSTSNPSTSLPMFGGRFGGPDHAFGAITITAISGSNISLKTADGWTRTITVDSGTTYSRAGTTISLSDLKVGDEIRFSESLQSSGAYTIETVQVVLPQLYGTVTSVSGSTITLRLSDGSTGTVNVSSGTTYQVGTDTSAALSDVKVGMVLVAEGTKASDGSLSASAIRAGNLGAFMGPGMGGRGMGMGHDVDGGGAGPTASAAPSLNG
jgi:hypothetical protein